LFFAVNFITFMRRHWFHEPIDLIRADCNLSRMAGRLGAPIYVRLIIYLSMV
jgi:hypothetical protein